MLIIIILAVVTAIIVTLAWIRDDELLWIIGGVLSFFFVCTVIVTSCNRIAFKNRIMDYYALTELIETHRESVHYSERAYIWTEIHETNVMINRHKRWANNIWTNWFYSKEIAELPYIK